MMPYGTRALQQGESLRREGSTGVAQQRRQLGAGRRAQDRQGRRVSRVLKVNNIHTYTHPRGASVEPRPVKVTTTKLN